MTRPDDVSEQDEELLFSPQYKTVSPARAGLERRASRVVGSSLGRMSWRGCRLLGSKLGLAFFAVGRRRRELAIANVRQALGLNRAQAFRVARRSAQNWGMTTCEFLHMPAAGESEIRDYVNLGDISALHAVLEEGRGAIVLTAHLGNWELLAGRLAQEIPLSAIVRPISSVVTQEHMSRVRRSTGMDLISKHAAARPALKALHGGKTLLILPDRHAGPDGVLLPLFGQETRYEIAPARFAVMSGAPIVPIYGVRREPWLSDGRIDARVFPTIKVEAASRDEREAATIEGTRQIIANIETVVRQHPDQWSWMLRRWRDDDAQ